MADTAPLFPPSDMQLFRELAGNVKEAVSLLRELRSMVPQPNIDTSVYIGPQPYLFQRQNRAYSRLWSPISTAILVDNLTGSFASIFLTVGWNPIDLANNAQIKTTGEPFQALLRLSDYPTSGAEV